ncbi:unnamed protein product, partial [marine sediment metagenome]
MSVAMKGWALRGLFDPCFGSFIAIVMLSNWKLFREVMATAARP